MSQEEKDAFVIDCFGGGGSDWAQFAVCVGSNQFQKSHETSFASVLRSQTKIKLLPDGQIKCPVSELEKTLAFDWRLKRLHRQTAAVILIHHIHPVPPFVVRDCSQHLYQITLMHRKNLFFCSTPDRPFNSVWDWTRINPSLVMSCTLTKLPV